MRTGDEWTLFGIDDVDGLKDCVEAICEVWPEAVVEDTVAGEFAYSVQSLVPQDDSELCVYRDLDTARRWQNGEVNGITCNSMIQLNLAPAGLRLIADDWRDAELKDVLESVSRSGSPSRT